MRFLDWLHDVGGLCSLEAALDRVGRAELDSMRGTNVWAPLRGWIALVGVRDARTAALGLGGVLSCLSLLRSLGIWTPEDARLHVRVVRRTHSDRTAASAARADAILHRLRERHHERRPTLGVDSVLDAIAAAATCVGRLDLITIVGDAVAKGFVTVPELRCLVATLPQRGRAGLLAIDGRSESCSEARLAELLRLARIAFRQQVAVLSGIRVDFLIGARLVVECDSRLWHGGTTNYERDRERDARLAAAGYVVIRVSYRSVMERGDEIVARIRAARRLLPRAA
ncbi:DUF559 domain-containing protein [Agrococcus sp. SL85]|uniref:endonuclease domain-containing protein n=1 Tax=Agrococcus sp. SL85 TaxID=2995141 RepID=UPI00226C7B74|nr:DUF559 domain-containing protein [Agrococcus sp. SL85]WAC67345.1 DUF559 domain-containing protein [Agrococcus sp. SL85]